MSSPKYIVTKVWRDVNDPSIVETWVKEWSNEINVTDNVTIWLQEYHKNTRVGMLCPGTLKQDVESGYAPCAFIWNEAPPEGWQIDGDIIDNQWVYTDPVKQEYSKKFSPYRILRLEAFRIRRVEQYGGEI